MLLNRVKRSNVNSVGKISLLNSTHSSKLVIARGV
jgi:hypothetical protein